MEDVKDIHPGLKIYNTATKCLEEFRPVKAGEAGIYVCGPTVYDDCHVGHARAMVAFDVAVRWLEHRGYKVKYVRNITDIDDKIIKRAAERGVSCTGLAEQYIRSFHDDTQALSLRAPDVEPRATEHIPDMIRIIGMLMEKGLAYESGGDVYFDVGAYKKYGAFSGRNTEELLAGARVEVNEQKKNPLDFALWKAAKAGEPEWPSPWGPGRPGWHIECSAMSAKYLGDTFDIHGGGQDLIFPHHENEIAQSEGATGRAPARYWLHNAHVTVDQTKMSKSLGNFFTLKDIFKKYPPRVVRFFLISKQYRSPIDYSEGSLAEAATALRRIDECIYRVEKETGGAVDPAGRCPVEFEAAMDEDFNTAGALGVIFSLINAANVEIAGRGEGWREHVREKAGYIRACCGLLGMEIEVPEVISTAIEVPKVISTAMDVTTLVKARLRTEDLLLKESFSAEEVKDLLVRRESLRKERNFDLADRIRAKLSSLGYEVRDAGKQGSTVRKQ